MATPSQYLPHIYTGDFSEKIFHKAPLSEIGKSYNKVKIRNQGDYSNESGHRLGTQVRSSKCVWCF